MPRQVALAALVTVVEGRLGTFRVWLASAVCLPVFKFEHSGLRVSHLLDLVNF